MEAAFAVGWVVWFASAVAAVLYAMGFAVFFVPFLEQVLRLAGNEPPAWLGDRLALVGYALCAVAFYAWRLSRFAVGGRQWETMGKVVVLVVLILAGFFAIFTDAPAPAIWRRASAPSSRTVSRGCSRPWGTPSSPSRDST